MAEILQHLECTKKVRLDQVTGKISVISKIIPLLYPPTPLPPRTTTTAIFSYFSGPCTKKLAAIRTSNVSDLTNQRACRSSFGRTRFPHLCSLLQLLHGGWMMAMGILVERCFRGAIKKATNQQISRYSICSMYYNLPCVVCLLQTPYQPTALLGAGCQFSVTFNPNLEHFWVNGRIVCPEWQWNKENYPHKRPVLDAFGIITPGFVTLCFRRYPTFLFMFSNPKHRNVTIITAHPRMTRPSYQKENPTLTAKRLGRGI